MCLIHQAFSETERDLHKLHLLKADLTTASIQKQHSRKIPGSAI